MVGLIIDFVLVVIFALSILIGGKKGFARSMLGIVSFAVAVIAAFSLNARTTQYLESHDLYDSLVAKVESALVGEMGMDEAEQEAAAEEGGFFSSMLALFGKDAIAEGETLVQNATHSVSEYLSRQILKAGAFAGVFLLTLLGMNILMRLLDLIFRIPGLKQVNRYLGYTFGAIRGFLLVWLISIATGLVFVLLQNQSPIFAAGASNVSYVIGWIFKLIRQLRF